MSDIFALSPLYYEELAFSVRDASAGGLPVNNEADEDEDGFASLGLPDDVEFFGLPKEQASLPEDGNPLDHTRIKDD
jgi:hypothetical protein